MSRRLPAALLAAGPLLLLAGTPRAADPEVVAADEKILKDAGVAADGPGLLAFLRALTPDPAAEARVRELVRQLGADAFAAREKAAAALVALGPGITPLVRRAAADADPEVRRRAAECLRRLEVRQRPAVAAAAARLVGVRKPAGAAAALLAYAPFADDEEAAEAVRAALAVVATHDGRAEPAVVAALADPSPARRGAAAEALARSGAAGQLPAVRKLLKDPEPVVRLGAALGLAAARDRDAVPALIDLLGELPPAAAWQAEDVLLRLAGESAPAVPLGDDDAGRRRCRAAWAGWWEKNAAGADLGRLAAPASLGLTLVVVFNGNGGASVVELGPDGKPRWEIKGLGNVIDARVVRNDRVLIAEYAGKVTERDFKGKVLWEWGLKGGGRVGVDGPIACQRLPGGGTFAATFSQLVEVDRAGKQVYCRKDGFGFKNAIRAAHKLRDGRTVLITTGNEYVRLNAAGKEEKRFPVELKINNSVGGVGFLPGGGVLIAQGDKVAEYSRDGQVGWQAPATWPEGLSRLPNGHTLVASSQAGKLVELDRAGKEVRSFTVDGRPWLARRR